MKKIAIFLLIVIIIIGLFYSISTSQTINVNDYVKDKFPSIFSFYLSSFEELDQYEKEFIDLLEKLPKEEREYYAKEVYKNGFSLELLENVKEGKTIQVPASNPVLPSLSKAEEKPIESLPSLIKRIEPSIVVVFTYRGKFDIALKKKKEDDLLRLGSGFFISQSGDIITNYHVFEGAGSAEVRTSDGKTYPITHIVAFDEQNDIIRLSVDIPSKYVLPLSLSKTTPEIGERIIVYGSPLGLENSVSDGIVSSVRKIFDYDKIIQITAPISPGSSGSPVLNMKGEVIGIATFQIIEGQNLNFAIPSEKIANLKVIREKKTITTKELFWGLGWGENVESNNIAQEAYDKALYFIGKREYEKALPYLEIAIKTDISSLKAWAYYSIGYCYDELGAYTEVIEALRQVIRIEPNFASAHHNLGVVYSELGDYADAIEAYKQAIRINPDYVSACYGLGVNYAKLGFYKDAIEAFKQAIRITPDYVYAHYGLGLNYLIIGDKSSALNEYKILKELDIDLANVLFDLIYK